MINARKGPAHSLGQTDFIGSLYASEGVVAGMLVYKTTAGEIRKVATIGSTDAQVGFAVTNQDEGDAIESNKIGAYALDGGSVIETDQFTGTYTASDVGKPVIYSGTAGKVKAVASSTLATGGANVGAKVVGKVFDAPRSIFVGQTAVTVLPIKLSDGLEATVLA